MDFIPTYSIPLPWVLALLLPPTLYLLHRSLQPIPLPGIPIAYPDGYTHIPWYTGFLPQLQAYAQKHRTATGYFNEMAVRHGPVCQIILGPAGTWWGKWAGLGSHIVICNDSQGLGTQHWEPLNQKLTMHAPDARIFSLAYPKTTKSSWLPSQRAKLRSSPGHSTVNIAAFFGPSMSANFLGNTVPRIEACADEFVNLWRTKMSISRNLGEKAIEVREDLTWGTVDLVSSVTFGINPGGIKSISDHLASLDSPSSSSSKPPIPRPIQCIQRILSQIGRNARLGPLAPLDTFYQSYISPSFRSARGDFVKLIEKSIFFERAKHREALDMGEKDGTERPSEASHVLAMVLEAEHADVMKGNTPLPHDDLVDEAITFMLGGADTTSTALAWSFRYLSRHPNVQHKLHAELSTVLPRLRLPCDPSNAKEHYAIAMDDTKTPYLHAVVYECLRLARVAGGIARTTLESTDLLGVPIPKNTMCIFSIGWCAGESSDSGPEKEKADSTRAQMPKIKREERKDRRWGWWDHETVHDFRPARWLDANGRFQPLAGPWQVFGSGPRGCFGQRLAMIDLFIIIAKICGNFFLERLDPELDDDEYAELITRNPDRCRLRLTERKEVEL